MAYNRDQGEKDIQCNVLDTIHRAESDRGDGGSQIRIVEWVVNGKKMQPQIEKREFFMRDGKEMMGKAKGFNKTDLWHLVINLRRIQKHIDFPLDKALAELIHNAAEPEAVAAAAENPGGTDPW